MIKKLATSYNLGNVAGLGPLYTEISGTGLSLFEKVVSLVIAVMTVTGGLYFLFIFITAAYQWMNAGGDKAMLQKAHHRILYASIGLAIVVGAYAIVSLISYVLGFCILRPENVLSNIWP
jgi:hypothetical protein